MEKPVVCEELLEIIKNNFLLGEEGFNNFCRIIKKNYSNLPNELSFLNEENNFRKFIKIPEEYYEFIDEGFSVLKNLDSFCKKYNITFNDYYDNLKQVENQKIKLFKLLNNYYYDEISKDEERYGIILDAKINYELLEEICLSKPGVLSELFNCYKKYYKPSERNEFNSYLKFKNIYYTKEIFNEILLKIFEKIGKFRIKSNDDLYFVISKNPNDIFLCSYEKSWTSCLNPESQSGLWSCLPFILSDYGRCVLYITDKHEKEYKGIKSYNMLKRSFGIIGTKDNETKIYSQFYYPSKVSINEIFYEKIGVQNYISNICEGFVSKYALDLFYNEYNVFDYIYQDNTFFIHGKDGRILLSYGEHNHNIIYFDKKYGISFLNTKFIDDGITLTSIINNENNINNFVNNKFCKRCKKYIKNKKYINNKDGEIQSICQDCFTQMFLDGEIHCSNCNTTLKPYDDIIETQRFKFLCRTCYNKIILKEKESDIKFKMARIFSEEIHVHEDDEQHYEDDNEDYLEEEQ